MVYFETKNPNLGNSLECLAMEDVGIHYGHLVYLTAILHTLWAFGKFLGNLVIFSRFGMLYQEKSAHMKNDFLSKDTK
jgi:hypothetical protein